MVSVDLPASAKRARWGSDVLWAWLTSLSCAGSYMLTYFWRYPVFMLPPEILHRPVVNGRLDLQACLSLAFVSGFACAKLPAAAIASSSIFFRRRLQVLLVLMTISMAIEGLGLLSDAPAVMIGSVFSAALFSSTLWGLMLTYLEGRRSTERHVAIATLCLIYAGNASRGTASAVLDAGVPANIMPLLVGGCALVPACLLLLVRGRPHRGTLVTLEAPIHTYIHTYMHACIHTYIHTYIYTYVHTYIHAYIHTYMHTYEYPLEAPTGDSSGSPPTPPPPESLSLSLS